MFCGLEDWMKDRRCSLWSHTRQCNELPGFDTVFPNRQHTHPDRQGLTNTFCCRHFPSLPPSFLFSSPGLVSVSVSVPAYQTWQYQLAAGKLTARGYKLCLSVCVCVWMRMSTCLSFEGVCPYFLCGLGVFAWLHWLAREASNTWTCWFKVIESEPEWSESQVLGCFSGWGLEQYLIPIKIVVNTWLTQLCTLVGAWHLLLSDSLSTLKATYLPILQ